MNPDQPIEIDAADWPSAEIDPVAKLRALAAGLPHAAIDETVFDVPFDEFWAFIEDLEASVPRFEAAVAGLRIVERDGDKLRIETRTPLGMPIGFDCILRPGWCLMDSSRGQVGMAARPENERQTRFIHFERSRQLGRLTRPFFAWNIRQDFRRLRALLRPEV